MNIVVIDDGVDESFLNIGNLTCDLEVDDQLNVIQRGSHVSNKESHGTICAAIISKYYRDAQIISLKILDSETKKTSKEKLIKAIEWCVEENIDIINLSIGSIDYRDFELIEKVVKRAYNSEIIIVAANSNQGVYTYPAGMPEVISVMCDWENKLVGNQFLYLEDNDMGIDVMASGVHLLEKISGELYMTNECNSFATPVITAHIANIMNRNTNLKFAEIKEYLKNVALSSEIKLLSNSIYSETQMDIPIVVITGATNYKKYHFMKCLHRLFRENGYNSFCIMQKEKNNIIKGEVAVQKEDLADVDKIVTELGILYNSDIVLIHADIPFTSTNYDVKVKVFGIRSISVYLIKTDTNWRWHMKFFWGESKKNEIMQIYNYIVNILGGT